MVASKQTEISFYRGFGRHRGRAFATLAQVLGRTANPLLRKDFLPASKRVGAGFLDFVAPEIEEVVSVKTN